jgi:hypothetical protein
MYPSRADPDEAVDGFESLVIDGEGGLPLPRKFTSAQSSYRYLNTTGSKVGR